MCAAVGWPGLVGIRTNSPAYPQRRLYVLDARPEPLAWRARVRLPPPRQFPPRGPTARRPGRPGGRGFGGAAKAIAMSIGAVALKKFWAWRWYVCGGFGAYILIRCVKCLRERRSNANSPVINSAVAYYLSENLDAKSLLSAYLLEVLKKEECRNLDVYTTTSSFGSFADTTGPSVAFYCSEHLHLKVVNHVNCSAPMNVVRVALDSLRRVMTTSVNLMDANGYIVNEVGNGVSFCALSEAGQGIGLFINQELGNEAWWDCCSESVHEPVFLGRSRDDMSFMASRRVSPDGIMLEIMPGDPAFIILACDGISNLLQNMALLEFAYQGVRNDMDLRPLCETLLDLIQSSSVKMAVVLVQFKPPRETHHQQDDQDASIDRGEGTSSSEGSYP